MDEIEKRLQQLEKATEAQASDGTYNCNPYMWGLANGLILALHTMRGDTVEVPYKKKPDEWLDDRYEVLKAQGRLPTGGEVKDE